MNKQRRHFSGTDKIAVLKRRLVEKTPVSQLCDEAQIAPTQFYRWVKDFFENAHRAFDNGQNAKAADNANNVDDSKANGSAMGNATA